MKFYVYVIFGPTGLPCYIGKGSGYRWQHHVRFSHNRRLARLYRDADGDLPIVKIRDDLSESDAFAHKAALSRAAIGRKNGPASEHRREGIRKALLAFWDSRRQQGLPLRHAREDS